jgi:acyl dehydratase
MFEVGQVATAKRVLRQEDFDRFAALSGDDNPIHVDPQFSARTRFGKTVCHGMLLYGLICGVLSRHFPGVQSVEQDLMFPNPAFVDDEVTVRVEVIQVQPQERLARLEARITRGDGEVVCQGQTLVRWEAT